MLLKINYISLAPRYVPLFSLVYEIRFNDELFFEAKVTSGRIVADT